MRIGVHKFLNSSHSIIVVPHSVVCSFAVQHVGVLTCVSSRQCPADEPSADEGSTAVTDCKVGHTLLHCGMEDFPLARVYA
jgi:hypothetical protein